MRSFTSSMAAVRLPTMRSMETPSPDPTRLYVDCMQGIRRRVTYVKWLINDKPLGDEAHGKLLRTELNFVQFRKILELIAFSTLTANKEKYAEAHANFSTHWKAVRMLEAVEK